MKKIIIIPILALICYLFSALYSLHQIHKGIYYNNQTLIKSYVEWNQLRENFKNYFNQQLLKETEKNEDFQKLGKLGYLVSGFTGKIIDNLLHTYLNPEGLSILLEKNKKIKEMPEPNFNTLILGINIIDFTGHSSFIVKHKIKNQEISVFFQRFGLVWKINKIQFPDNFFKELKKSYLK